MRENKNLFRDFYHKYVLVPLLEEDRSELKDYEGYLEANYVLCFGFVAVNGDLKVYASRLVKTGTVDKLFSPSDGEVLMFENFEDLLSRDYICDYPMDAEEDDDFLITELVESENFGLSMFYAIQEIDELRDPFAPGHVRVRLIKEGLEPEECMVSCTQYFITNLGVGTLLEEPKQDFGYRMGNDVSFYVSKDESGAFICLACLDVETDEPEGSLEDGTRLNTVIQRMHRHPNMEHFIDVMDVLSDCKVMVPCNTMEIAPKSRVKKALQENTFQMEAGMEGCFKIGGLKFEPVVCTGSDGRYFFQVYTDEELMKRQVNYDVPVWKTTLEAFVVAINLPVEMSGLVVNPDGENSIMIERALWDRVLNMSDLLDTNKARKQS